MGFSTELTKAPDQVTVGEEFTVELTVCYDGTGPTGQSMDLKLDGEVVAPANVPAFETCIPFSGPATITTPGEHTLSWPEGTKTITAVKPQIDPALVEGSCSTDTPESLSPGDQITLTETLSNGNSEPVDVSLTFSLGGATQTRSVTVPANGSETASATFTAESEGTLDPQVEFTVQT